MSTTVAQLQNLVNAGAFLSALFGHSVKADQRVAVWTKRDRGVAFFASPTDAAEYAVGRAATSDGHFGVGLYRPGILRGRGSADDVVAIPGVWADIDIADGEAHAAKTLPPSEADGARLLARFELQPSVMVASGHGLHAYWLFDQPWAFPADCERQQASAFLRQWGMTEWHCRQKPLVFQ